MQCNCSYGDISAKWAPQRLIHRNGHQNNLSLADIHWSKSCGK